LSSKLRIGMAQINPVLGDLRGNTRKISEYIRKAGPLNLDLLIFPELSITGYSPQDLLLNAVFVESNLKCLGEIARASTSSCIVVVGFVERRNGQLFNSAALIRDGRVIATRQKTLLPNYDVFDEKRYFQPAESNDPIALKIRNEMLSIGVEICEDLWDADSTQKVTDNLVSQGAELIINISASPFEYNKRDVRRRLVSEKVQHLRRPVVLVNLVGGQDELVFDGNSLMLDAEGSLIGWGGEFVESLVTCEIDRHSWCGKSISLPDIEREESIYKALVLGIRDYVHKTGAEKVLLGLSGGVDSALVACLAVEALGKEQVLGVSLPSRFSAPETRADARRLAANLGIQWKEVPIDKIFGEYLEQLQPVFNGLPEDVTEENLQSRIRGNLLMGLSNKLGHFLLNTGNKTELALGYCTLYGDMCGALAVISDLSKTDVYKLAEYVNRQSEREMIPQSIIERVPTAELAEGQYDPFDYNIVSPLVDALINDQKSRPELIAMGYAPKLVDDIMDKIRKSEYKRHQAAPGLKITGKAFGIGRRWPIINHFREQEWL